MSGLSCGHIIDSYIYFFAFSNPDISSHFTSRPLWSIIYHSIYSHKLASKSGYLHSLFSSLLLFDLKLCLLAESNNPLFCSVFFNGGTNFFYLDGLSNLSFYSLFRLWLLFPILSWSAAVMNPSHTDLSLFFILSTKLSLLVSYFYFYSNLCSNYFNWTFKF